MSTVKKLFAAVGIKNTAIARSMSGLVADKPCPGISEKDIANVERYLMRSPAAGGGSRSVFKIATEKFQKAFSRLKPTAQEEVRLTQQHEQTWKNDHACLRVFSTACRATVPDSTSRILPCSSCAKLLSSKSFKRTLRKPTPEAKNYIYTNMQFRNPVLGNIYARTVGLQAIIEQPVTSLS
jgi:hypothetical protein